MRERTHPIARTAGLCRAVVEFRSEDIRRRTFCRRHERNGCLCFTQHKNRNRAHLLELFIRPELRHAMDATKLGDWPASSRNSANRSPAKRPGIIRSRIGAPRPSGSRMAAHYTEAANQRCSSQRAMRRVMAKAIGVKRSRKCLTWKCLTSLKSQQKSR